MPWCPQCGYEYEQGASVCLDCGVALSDQQPAHSPEELRRMRERKDALTIASPPEPAFEPGRWCPICAAQYRPGATVCPDCGVALVDEPPSEVQARANARRPFLQTVLAHLRGASDLPPSFIERFLAAPETRWNAVLAFAAVLSLASYAMHSPAWVYERQAFGAFEIAPWLRWMMAGTGVVYYAFAGLTAGAITRRLPWVWVFAGIAMVWSRDVLAYHWGRGGEERSALEWMVNPAYLALGAAYVAAAIGMVKFGRSLGQARARALVASVAVALFFGGATERWCYRAADLIPWEKSDLMASALRFLTLHSSAIAAGVAAVGLGWLLRKNGWLLGVAFGVFVALSRITYPWTSLATPLMHVGLGALFGFVGCLIGQRLVARFHRWAKRTLSRWPAVMKGFLVCAALSSFVGFLYFWLGFPVISAVGMSYYRTHMWPSWTAGILGSLLVGAAIGRIFYGSPSTAGAMAAGAMIFRWAESSWWTARQTAYRLADVIAMVAAAYVVAWAYKRAVERRNPPQKAEEPAVVT